MAVAILQPRDIEIFKLLSRYRYLQVDFIHAFVGGNLAALQRRLSILAREPNGFLNRPDAQRRFANANYRYQTYELARRGKELLRDHELPSGDARVGDERQFVHAMMVNNTLASIELGVRRFGRFITLQEIRSHPNYTGPASINVSVSCRAANNTDRITFNYRHDALFGIEHDGFRFFQLEAEHLNRVQSRSLRQTSFLKKFLAIQQIVERQLYRTQWGVPNLVTLVAAPNRRHVDAMKEVVLDQTGGKGASHILFRAVPAIDQLVPISPNPDIAVSAWERAGYSEFSFV